MQSDEKIYSASAALSLCGIALKQSITLNCLKCKKTGRYSLVDRANTCLIFAYMYQHRG